MGAIDGNNPLAGLDDNLFLDAQRETESLKERLLELYLLYATSRTCGVALQTDALFSGIVDLLKNTLKVEEFCLMLRDPESDRFEVWTGDDRVMAAAGDVTFAAGEGVAGQVVATGEAILVQDVAQEPRFLHYQNTLADIGAFLSAPLVGRDGQVFGVLNIHKATPNSFREQDKDFYCAVAHNLAAALERAQLFERMRREAMHDELTGLYNRRYLYDCGRRELHKAERARQPVALLLLDLDNFKEVNDFWGHLAGDRILRELGGLLRCNLRQSDIAARYGGEEFVVLLPDTAIDDACQLADKLRRLVEEKLVLEEGDERRAVTTTIGVAAYPADGNDLEALLAGADQRLYAGKTVGRNQVVGAEAAESPAAAGQERRIHPRRRAAWRVVPDAADSGRSEIHSIDIRYGDQWIPCALMNVSSQGFNGMVYFPPEVGEKYYCRAVLGARNGHCRDFTVQVRHVEFLDERQYLVGAQVGDGDVGNWKELYSTLLR